MRPLARREFLGFVGAALATGKFRPDLAFEAATVAAGFRSFSVQTLMVLHTSVVFKDTVPCQLINK
ncbi:hypothetical protein B0G80_4660 [Paraburkholderia sp. BL6669N2]|nr:hypothetical protein B0G80_4660 [Paraburkholderia sp. BL6669N2]